MNRKTIRSITVLLLGLGLGAAIVVYLMAGPEEEPPFGDPLASKRYVHELGVYGGRSNVMMAELVAWFQGLWHGRALGETIGVLTVMATLVFRFLALRPELFAPLPESELLTPRSKQTRSDEK